MSAPLSQTVALATSMHAQPGVYAVLLGSGVSTAAGIPTGWGVVRELVRRLAAASGGDVSETQQAWEDPETWWTMHGTGALGYSTLLERLAPTPPARQGLLVDFFLPTDEEREEGLKLPTKAHYAVAELVKRGLVRVVITTNFDRLMEQALESTGISPQVISRPEAVNGMAPLAHSPATVIKLHGDYKDLGARNTPEELGEYPTEWMRLLSQVFDEYGLIVSGWSADWDSALVAALEGAPNRRYPLYWDSRSSKGENARRLLSGRAGIELESDSADELFVDLLGNIDALERLSNAPLSIALAIARLKRYLPDPVRRIDLHDLVMGVAEAVMAHISSVPINPAGGIGMADLQEVYEGYFGSMEQLVPLLKTGIWHDPEGVHDQLWLDVLQSLIDAGTAPTPQGRNDALWRARLFPAFIALATAGITASRRDRDALLIRLATYVEGRIDTGGDNFVPASHLLHYARLADGGWVNNLPRWSDTEWRYPQSHLFTTEIWRYFEDDYPSFSDYQEAFHGFEYRLGLIQERANQNAFLRAISGEYVGDRAWTFDGVPLAETAFRRQLERSRSLSWQEYLGGIDAVDGALLEHREVIANYRRW